MYWDFCRQFAIKFVAVIIYIYIYAYVNRAVRAAWALASTGYIIIFPRCGMASDLVGAHDFDSKCNMQLRK